MMRFSRRVRLVIWTTGIVVMFAMTTRDFIPLLSDYRHHNYAPQINISSESISPNATICLPYYSTLFWSMLPIVRGLNKSELNSPKSIRDKCYRCDWMRNNSWDFWNYVDVNSEDAVFKFLIEKLLKEGLDHHVYGRPSFEWLQPAIDTIWYYFKLIYNKDLAVLLADDTFGSDYVNVSYGFWFPNEILEKLHDYVLKSVGDMVAGGCIFKGPDNETKTISVKELIRLPSFTILGEHFCLPIPEDYKKKEVECWFNDQLYPWNRFDGGHFQVYPSPSMLYSMVGQKDSVYSTDYRTLRGEHPAEHVNLTYDIDSTLIATRPGDSCSEEPYADVCIIRRQVEAAVSNCHCVPFRFRHMAKKGSQTLPYCNETHYNLCQEKLARRLSHAQDECRNKCQYTFYSWWPSKVSIEDADGGYDTVKRFHVALRASKKPFIEFSLGPKFTWEQFLSQMGGLLNFYLGISGLTMFAFLVMGFDHGMLLYKKRNENDNKEASGSSLGWQYLKMMTIFQGFGMTDRERQPREPTDLDGKVDQIMKEMEEMKKSHLQTIEALQKEIRELKERRIENVNTVTVDQS